jgi:hypothetical protein
MRAMANSFLFFKLKDYNKIIENLGKVRFIDIRDKFFVKSLYIRAYYELGDHQAMLYQIDSAKQFVSNNTGIAKHTREGFSAFLNYVTNFMHLLENNNFHKTEVLKKNIDNDKSFVNKDWLLEKIKELEPKKALR